MSNANANALIWVDVEMTGLNPDTDFILEIALLITDEQLNVLDEGIECQLYCDEVILASMDNWNQNTHGQSGLLEKCRASELGVKEVESMLLDYLADRVPPGQSPLCGNNIQQDRRFLRKYTPVFHSYLSHRNIDVSTLKELCSRWASADQLPQKNNGHRALDDIQASIDELRHYRQKFMTI